MIGDSYIIKLVFNTLQTNERSFSADYEKYIQDLSDHYLNVITTTCPQVSF